jgi:uncharacterized membrane protein YphA (DoxX/SURF4 family)
MIVGPVAATIVRLALGWLFVAAATHKLNDMADFGSVLGTYRIVPERLVSMAAWLVTAVELAVGVGLVVHSRVAAIGAAALLIGYGAAIGVNLARGRRAIDCGCGGAPQPLSVALVVRNVLLAVAALALLLPFGTRPLTWVDVVATLLGVLVLGVLYTTANQVIAARARFEEDWV